MFSLLYLLIIKHLIHIHLSIYNQLIKKNNRRFVLGLISWSWNTFANWSSAKSADHETHFSFSSVWSADHETYSLTGFWPDQQITKCILIGPWPDQLISDHETNLDWSSAWSTDHETHSDWSLAWPAVHDRILIGPRPDQRIMKCILIGPRPDQLLIMKLILIGPLPDQLIPELQVNRKLWFYSTYLWVIHTNNIIRVRVYKIKLSLFSLSLFPEKLKASHNILHQLAVC